MIDFIVYDSNLEPLGIVDTQNSVMWERRFYEAGYFEIHVPPNDNNNALLIPGNYIMRADARESGFIQYINKNTDIFGVTDVTIIGRFMSYILHGHVVRASQTFSGNAEAVMRQLVNEVCMTAGTFDYIDGLELGDLCGTTKNVSLFLEYPDLHDALREIARLSGVAFRITLDPETNALVFECYEGHDYRANQYENPQVIFSSDYDTIVGEVNSTEDESEIVNAVTMLYAGDLGTVAVRYSPVGATGKNLHEKCIVTDKCETFTIVGGGKALDVSGTEALLLSMAPQYIVNKTFNVSAAVSSSGSFEYKKDYDIGDIVTVQHTPYGISETRRIHKITESYNDFGNEIIPGFGDISPKEITS